MTDSKRNIPSLKPQSESVLKQRRRLVQATAVGGGVATLAALVPFAGSLSPSERTKTAGAPIEVDISQLKEGEMMTVEWRGKPIWIIRRNESMINSIQMANDKVADAESKRSEQPTSCQNLTRSIRPDVMVMVGICTHLGCSPTANFKFGNDSGLGEDWPGGFICPCHGSIFDLAGRVFKSMPAPTNLEVPLHHFINENRLLIGSNATA